jgi:hypothetical protein
LSEVELLEFVVADGEDQEAKAVVGELQVELCRVKVKLVGRLRRAQVRATGADEYR